MSRDLLGEFGDFQTSATTTNNAFQTSNSNFDDLLGLFSSTTTPQVGAETRAGGGGNNDNNNKTSEAIFNFPNDGGNMTLFSTSPHLPPDDFGDFAVEPLPSSTSFGPFSNSSPPQPPTIIHPSTDPQEEENEEFGIFISTPRVPTPPPTFSLSSTITSHNFLHPPHPPPGLYLLLPVLTSQLLTPTAFLNRLKPLSYPAKQRLLASPRVKEVFVGIILLSHVVARLIASKKIRGRRHKSLNSKNSLKDEREVSECVREYNEILGSLRAVVRGMGVGVVELSGDMEVGIKKGVVEFCWLCGLSPVERVVKLKEDENIEKSRDIDGGERWVGGWGHRSCRNWWDHCGDRFINL
ncbi:hypothetical protein TWF481_011083 [Arthrobotrys musiformis]|uniref:Uncharacterized protein n=1 Tax=Arthrobotrys musiformis TaxID=47236 RepID=A0AAV9VYC9_9PEZI